MGAPAATLVAPRVTTAPAGVSRSSSRSGRGRAGAMRSRRRRRLRETPPRPAGGRGRGPPTGRGPDLPAGAAGDQLGGVGGFPPGPDRSPRTGPRTCRAGRTPDVRPGWASPVRRAGRGRPNRPAPPARRARVVGRRHHEVCGCCPWAASGGPLGIAEGRSYPAGHGGQPKARLPMVASSWRARRIQVVAAVPPLPADGTVVQATWRELRRRLSPAARLLPAGRAGVPNPYGPRSAGAEDGVPFAPRSGGHDYAGRSSTPVQREGALGLGQVVGVRPVGTCHW